MTIVLTLYACPTRCYLQVRRESGHVLQLNAAIHAGFLQEFPRLLVESVEQEARRSVLARMVNGAHGVDPEHPF